MLGLGLSSFWAWLLQFVQQIKRTKNVWCTFASHRKSSSPKSFYQSPTPNLNKIQISWIPILLGMRSIWSWHELESDLCDKFRKEMLLRLPCFLISRQTFSSMPVPFCHPFILNWIHNLIRLDLIQMWHEKVGWFLVVRHSQGRWIPRVKKLFLSLFLFDLSLLTLFEHVESIKKREKLATIIRS